MTTDTATTPRCSYVVQATHDDGHIDMPCGKSAVVEARGGVYGDMWLCKRHATDERIDLAWDHGYTITYLGAAAAV